jgi:hypothetical protein
VSGFFCSVGAFFVSAGCQTCQSSPLYLILWSTFSTTAAGDEGHEGIAGDVTAAVSGTAGRTTAGAGEEGIAAGNSAGAGCFCCSWGADTTGAAGGATEAVRVAAAGFVGSVTVTEEGGGALTGTTGAAAATGAGEGNGCTGVTTGAGGGTVAEGMAGGGDDVTRGAAGVAGEGDGALGCS